VFVAFFRNVLYFAMASCSSSFVLSKSFSNEPFDVSPMISGRLMLRNFAAISACSCSTLVSCLNNRFALEYFSFAFVTSV